MVTNLLFHLRMPVVKWVLFLCVGLASTLGECAGQPVAEEGTGELTGHRFLTFATVIRVR